MLFISFSFIRLCEFLNHYFVSGNYSEHSQVDTEETIGKLKQMIKLKTVQ